jgi:hypothetical protein
VRGGGGEAFYIVALWEGRDSVSGERERHFAIFRRRDQMDPLYQLLLVRDKKRLVKPTIFEERDRSNAPSSYVGFVEGYGTFRLDCRSSTWSAME